MTRPMRRINAKYFSCVDMINNEFTIFMALLLFAYSELNAIYIRLFVLWYEFGCQITPVTLKS